MKIDGHNPNTKSNNSIGFGLLLILWLFGSNYTFVYSFYTNASKAYFIGLRYWIQPIQSIN